MAIRPLNSVAGFSVGETPANIILANGDITTTNITTTGISNLNSIGNVKISGGGTGQVIATDGAGNLSFITIGTASLNNGSSNVTVANSGNITFSVAGNANVGTFTGTGLNVAGYLNATGNANVGNLGTAQVLATANVTAPQLISNTSTGTAPLVVSSTTLVSNLNADLLDGYNSAVANTANTVVVRDTSGNVSANFFIGDGSQLTGIGDAASIANGTSNVRIPSVNGNVTIGVAGNANVAVVTGTGVNVAGTLNATGNANVGNIGAARGVFTNIAGEGGNISNIQGANVSGTVSSATTAGTVTTAAQPNITSVGTLTSLSVTGTTTAGNLSTGGTLSVTGNANVGNLGTAGLIVADGNVSGGNLTTGGVVAATGNVSGGNLTTGGVVAATGNVSGGNLTTGGVVAATGNVSGGNLTTAGALSVTGNANVGNIGAAAGVFTTVAGTLTTNAQPNITSVGTLTSLTVTGTTTAGNLSTGGTLSVTGNANVGNLGTGGLITATGNVSGGNLTTAGVVAATGNVSGGNITTVGLVNATGNIVSSANVVTDLIVGRTSSVTITATGTDQNVNLVPTGNGSVNVGNFIISNLAAPVASTDAATKQYVDDVAQGLHTHDSCNAATSTTLATSSGGTITYNNGTGGVGATLTTTGSYTTIDGVTLTNGMRILVKDEANTAHNGIYDRTSSTVLTRSSDFNTPTEMAGGDFTFVTAGTLYDNTGWVMPDPVTTVGTSPVVWVQFSGAGTYTAGTGLVLNGNQFNIGNTTVTAGAYGNGDYNATFTVNSQGQLTAAANVAITANAANLTGTTLASTIVNSSLTSVGTLTSASVSGNVTAGNVYANSGTIGASLLTGTLTTAAQPNVTSVGTLTALSVTGNVSAGNVSGTTGAFTNVSGNGAALTSITGANVTGAVAFATTANSVAGANVSGQVANALVAGTVYTAAQPNITSVGTLTSLSVTGNVSAGNISATNGNLTTANVSGNVILGNASVTTAISWASATTTAVTANQTIASFSVTGVTGVEFVVKGVDSTGSKYSVATVQAVTDGTNVDYSTFGTVNLGGFTGSLAVNIVGGFVRLQVTPASSNSTVWTTQYRFI